jgi:transcriptional regulator of acetoin/glycerol metabolism
MSVKFSLNVQLHAIAFLYDHLNDFPVWIRRLTPAQLENMARVMIAWHGTMGEGTEILPLEETEKREITRAVSLCQGDFLKAAKALRIGKTTIYRKMRQWGYSVHNRLLIHQASVLAEVPHAHRQSQLNRQ